MNWITLQLMRYQLKKVQKQFNEETHYIVKQAKGNMLENYKTTIMFIKANSK